MNQPERLAVGFCRMLRLAGLRLPPSATISYAQALGLVGLGDRDAVYWAGRATLIHRPEDMALYHRLFGLYWDRVVSAPIIAEEAEPPPTLVLDIAEEDAAENDPEDQTDQDDSEESDGDFEEIRFSAAEVLTDKDFADCTDAELAELTRLMAGLRLTTYERRSRRLVPDGRSGSRPDLRRTVRWALAHQGEPVKRAYRSPSLRPRRLVLLLDVSGSMESYARALVRFAHAAVVARSRVEAFALGTRLTRLTRYLGSRDPDAALKEALPAVEDWAGGTRLGEGIQAFNDQWGVRGMARGSVVVILSDGWDRGNAELLGSEVARLHRVTHRLIWVNPLKATPGYAPLAAGMAAALPHVDHFIEGHAYASLEHLAALVTGGHQRRVA